MLPFHGFEVSLNKKTKDLKHPEALDLMYQFVQNVRK